MSGQLGNPQPAGSHSVTLNPSCKGCFFHGGLLLTTCHPSHVSCQCAWLFRRCAIAVLTAKLHKGVRFLWRWPGMERFLGLVYGDIKCQKILTWYFGRVFNLAAGHLKLCMLLDILFWYFILCHVVYRRVNW